MSAAIKQGWRTCAVTPRGLAWLSVLNKLEAMQAEAATQGNVEEADLVGEVIDTCFIAKPRAEAHHGN